MHAAVSIFCVIKGGGAAPTTLLVKQFRPPTGAMCLEFPAGLIDSGESAEAAALRELKEETARKQTPLLTAARMTCRFPEAPRRSAQGYVGTVVGSSPACSQSPGLTNESIQLVEVSVDLDAAENAKPAQQLGDDESIEVLRVPLAGLRQYLDDQAAAGVAVFTGLYFLAAGLDRQARA